MLKFAAGLLGLAACVGATGAQAGTLDTVKSRGQLICGANTALAGFGIPDSSGGWTGLDVDYCRAIAAAVLGDPTKVKFIPLNAKDRFPALQSGEVDVLIRNTTWTTSRDSNQGFLFAATDFYDGQGFMVRKKQNVSSAKELDGASICVQQGTTTELNLADYFRSNNIKYDSVAFQDEDVALKAFESGRCDAFTTDSSGLYAERIRLTNPDDYMVLPDIISKEPLASAVRQGDDQWFNVVRWSFYAMLNAEEAGVTSKNADDMLKSQDPNIRRMLGVEGDQGKGLGLDNKWAYNIVKMVGNYGEIFDKNVGDGSALKIKRGQNALWNKGGLQYGPPIR
ncbi:amino acid ABC transporter substrate-binding protein [Lichenihabitans sp. Uapishka_5]|uniref:amino acid ABC transporter substrate-binding protein n=1 Tax=Lichenihabitans sp. Uapishka_5 TaxID=3037302 RepID=UPI0029E81B18|nr:amino acid ABC transporter substrate-binding protein [Lichenihabitans sp. Uapishka_5]MDX7951619.1 amino acid ABC transporter substrate-binding protein [Lichenihabitans sp. Uapishka_5]